MKRTEVPTQEEVAAAKTAWDKAPPGAEKARAEALYRQLQQLQRRELLG